MIRISVGDIMTRHIISVPPTATLLDCAKKLAKERVNSIMVVKDRRLVGIITSRDILWAISKKPEMNIQDINVMKIATKKVAVLKPSLDIMEAFNKMVHLNFRRMPVISRGQLIGMITLKDILKIDPGLYTKSGEFTKIREEEEKLKKAKIDWPLEGFCENCGAFSELLSVENQLLCRDCRDEIY